MRLQFTKLPKSLGPHWISVADNIRDNQFLVSDYHLIIGQNRMKFNTLRSSIKLGVFHRMTITRKGNQLLVIWDGKEYSATGFADKIPKGASWVLGQDQDEPRGGFVATERFIGNICNFQMWNVGFTKEEASQFFENPLSFGKPAVYDSPPSYKFESMNGAFFY